MGVVRTIMAALLAISVAVAPATGGAIAASTPLEMSMHGQGDMPCRPPGDQQKSVPCALKCLSFVGAVLATAAVAPLYPVAQIRESLAAGALHGHLASPPTRPPPA